MKKKIIVLAHPRTGSSLLMQTLKILGLPVVGSFKRPDLPQEANPRGYYEDREILNKGINFNLLKKKQINLNGAAVKLALKPMVRQERKEQWKKLEQNDAKIFITTRKPIESVLSFNTFNKSNEKTKDFFIFVTHNMNNYIKDYKLLTEILLTQTPSLIPNIKFIDFNMAIFQAEKYARTVAGFLNMQPAEVSIKEAVNNIEPSLYRYQSDKFPDKYWDWYKKLKLDIVYDIQTKYEGMEVWRRIQDLTLKS